METVEQLWKLVELPQETLRHLELAGDPDTTLPTSFRVGVLAQASIACSALAAAYLHKLRTGESQEVQVDARHAALEFTSESWTLLNGKSPGIGWDIFSGTRKTSDGFVRLHTNFPHRTSHRDGVLELLGCTSANSIQDLEAALLNCKSREFETLATERDMCVAALRSLDQWHSHPQYQALKDQPLVQIIRVGDAPKRIMTSRSSTSPLDEIRVLDLTRVIAGPVAGRTLAAHGADVLWITSPHLPSLPAADVDTSRGKRTTQLDLNLDNDFKCLQSLVDGADVFLQSYRPGALESKGFGVDDVVRRRPGVVYASLNAYGWEGPWKHKRGFDSLVQCATGFNADEARAFNEFKGYSSNSPGFLHHRPLPVQVLDHAAGQLLAFGITTALCRTFTEGGSWEVRVSLAGVGQYLRELGRLNPRVGFLAPPIPYRTPADPNPTEVARLTSEWLQATDKHGVAEVQHLIAMKHAGVLSKTPVKAGLAPIVLDAHEPRWMRN